MRPQRKRPPAIDLFRLLGLTIGARYAQACVVPFDFVCACPEGYEPDADLMAKCAADGAGTASVMHDPVAAVEGADAIYADVWASMGQKEEADARAKIFAPFQVTSGGDERRSVTAGRLLPSSAIIAIICHHLPSSATCFLLLLSVGERGADGRHGQAGDPVPPLPPRRAVSPRGPFH